MDAILISNLDGSSQTFSKIAGYAKRDWLTYDAYFFLRKELEVKDIIKYRKAWSEGKIRHCKPYNGCWFDYTVRKEFKTLEEWAKDAGGTMEEILYGVNRVHKEDWQKTREAGVHVGQATRYVTLDRVLEYYGYVKPLKIQVPVCNIFDTFDDIAKELNITDLPVHGRSCLVKKTDGVVVVGRIIDQKYYELEDTHSKICISVPQDTQYEIKTYDRISDMPAGTIVYFRSEDGYFRSIDEIMKHN